MMKRLVFVCVGVLGLSAAAATISGTVTSEFSGDPLENIMVELFAEDGFGWYQVVSQRWTDVNGAYQFNGIDAGVYRLAFIDPLDVHVDEYFDSQNDLYDATDVVVLAEDNLGGIDASLMLGGIIEGHVTGPEGEPQPDAWVELQVWNGFYWSWVPYNGYTDEQGFYRITGVPPQTYRILFRSYLNNLVDQYYGGAFRVEQATDLPIASGQTVTGVDVQMAAGGILSGQITRPDGFPEIDEVEIHAFRRRGSDWESWTSVWITGSDGLFEVTGLPPGTYRLRLGGKLFGDDALLEEYYDNAADLEGATDLVLPPGGAIGNIDAELAVGSRISGRVTDASGTTGLFDFSVFAYRFDEGMYTFKGVGHSDVDGYYVVNGLEPGSYRLQATSYDETLVDGWHSNATLRSQATPVNVSPQSTVTNINLQIASASFITGRVTGPDGISPLDSVEVVAKQFDDGEWLFISYGFTDVNGEYSIGRLAPGMYRVQFWDYTGMHISEYYSNSLYDVGAMLVHVPTNGTVTNINASLALGCSISGTVTREDDGQPLMAIFATTYEVIGTNWEYRGYGISDDSGQYTIGGLNTGVYKVAFFQEGWREYQESRPFVPEWYDNATDFATGASIQLPTLEYAAYNINAALATLPYDPAVEPDLTAIIRLNNSTMALEYEGHLDVDYRVQRYDTITRRWLDTGAITIGSGPSDQVNVPVGTNGLNFLRLRQIP